MPERDINFDRVFARRGLKSLHSITPEARELLEASNPFATVGDLVARVAQDFGWEVAFRFVFGKSVPDPEDKAAMLELARERVEAGYGYRYASVISGLDESWLRTVLDPEKHAEKIARDRKRHKDKRAHRLAVMKSWYRRNRDKKLAYEAERRKKKEP